MHASCASLFACILLIAACMHAANAELVMVYSLQRHGARNVLPKGALLTETDLIGGPTLLPEGQRQTYNAGAAFRARYLSNTTCGATGTCLNGSDAGGGVSSGGKYGVVGQPGVGFGNFDVYVRSSALDRTLMSGVCFFNGVFPPDPAAPAANPAAYLPTGAQVVPVYTQSDQNDIIIRAYTKCPAYQDALEGWFGSAEFQSQANASAGLRAQVAARWPGTDTSLENWWNVYDAINVYRSYGLGAPTPNFTDIFTPIQDLAYWLEVRKMQPALTRNLLAGPLLADLLASMSDAVEAAGNGSQLYYKLVSLSGHYNTQLGLLAALGLEAGAGPAAAAFVWYRPSLPKLAAVLAFELHYAPATAGSGGSSNSSDSRMYVVRAVAQDGPSASYVTVPLPCASAAAAAALAATVNAATLAANATAAAANAAAAVGACTLDDFVALAAPQSMPEAADWCAACGNNDVAACRIVSLQSEEGEGGDGDGEAWKIAVSVVVTFVGALGLAVCGVCVWSRYTAGRQQQQGGAGGVGSSSSSSFLPGGKAAAAPAPGCFEGVGRGGGRGGRGDGMDAELTPAPFRYSSAAAHQI